MQVVQSLRRKTERKNRDRGFSTSAGGVGYSDMKGKGIILIYSLHDGGEKEDSTSRGKYPESPVCGRIGGGGHLRSGGVQ